MQKAKINFSKNLFFALLAISIVLFAIKKCEQEPRVITKTEYIDRVDTITKTIISDPKTVYVNKYKTVKGNDSIVYVKTPDSTTINANLYNTQLLSNNATADLKITTTGELLDVQGVIKYTEEKTTITKIKDKSGFYIYGMMPLNKTVSPEIGALYQVKNKLFISAGLQYDKHIKTVNIKIGIGIKIF